MKGRECDLVVIGGGLGGLVAATRGRALGLDVVVLEKSQYLGGVAAYSGGIVWVGNNHLGAKEGFEDSFEESAAYLNFISGDNDPNYDHELRDRLVNASPEIIRYFTEDVGVPFSVIGRADQYFPDAPGSARGGRSLEVVVEGLSLGDWRAHIRPSAHYEIGLSQREEFEHGQLRGDAGELSGLLAERQAEDVLTFGQGLVAGFLKAGIVDGGAEVFLKVDVGQLTQHMGRVTGAVGTIDGQQWEFKARLGVLLATGSYGSHPDAARMEGLPALKEQSPPILHGDALRLAGPTSAAVTRAGITFTSLGFPSASKTHPGSDEPLYHPVYASLAFPHCVIVNDKGQRFGDESHYGTFINDMQAFDAHKKTFPNYPAFMVMDDRYRQKYPLAHLKEWPEADLVKADTIQELAEQLGISIDGLVAGVDRYNAFVEQGHDDDFARGQHGFVRRKLGAADGDPNPTLGKLECAPYWGVRLEPVGVGIYSMGLQIDRHARAVDREGNPVLGLYVTGNAAAYTEILHGYEGGLANLRNIVYSYLAVSHAAGAPDIGLGASGPMSEPGRGLS